MTSLVAQLGNETAAVFEGVLPEEWRDHLEALAMSFARTANMVANPKWKTSRSTCCPRCMRSWCRAPWRWAIRYSRSSR